MRKPIIILLITLLSVFPQIGFCKVFGAKPNSESIELLTKDICSALHVESLFTHIRIIIITGDDLSKTENNGSLNTIFINPARLNLLLTDKTDQEYALEYCIAHEIGHIISVHNFSFNFSSTTYGNFLEELNCDKIAGQAVAALNQNMNSNEIEMMLSKFLLEVEKSTSHPPLVARIMSAKSGFFLEMLHEDMDTKGIRVYNHKTKKYELHLVEENEVYRILKNNRFLIEENTFQDNRISFKIMNFNDNSISYIEAKPKLKDIVKGTEMAEAENDEMINFYNLGNDLTLYDNANFNYTVIPDREFDSTVINFVYQSKKYVLKYTKGAKGNFISFKDPSIINELLIYKK